LPVSGGTRQGKLGKPAVTADSATFLAKVKVVKQLATGNRPSSAIFSSQAWIEIGRSLKLSGRELQIVRGVFDDRTEFAIAFELGISPHTIHSHMERLYHKLTVSSRVELVVRVMDEFLVLTISPQSIPPLIYSHRAISHGSLTT